ncbi:hypothetical protein C5P43_25960, partial [Escherichia coli]
QQDFTDPRAMIALMRQLPSMDSIQLTVLRKGARHDISIALRYPSINVMRGCHEARIYLAGSDARAGDFCAGCHGGVTDCQRCAE